MRHEEQGTVTTIVLVALGEFGTIGVGGWLGGGGGVVFV